MRDHAVAWAERGFRVFPCVPRGKIPKVKEFYNVATSDPDQVAAMWTDPVTGWPLDHNIGVATDDMIVVRGINVFPSQIEHVLVGIEGTQPHYQIIVDRQAHKLDEVEVLVEVEQRFFSDEIKQLNVIREKIRKEIENVLSIGVKVTLVEPKTIARSEGKAKRIVDKRTL